MINAKRAFVCACVLRIDIAIKLTNPISGINRQSSCTDSTLNYIISSYFHSNITIKPYYVIVPGNYIPCNTFQISFIPPKDYLK